MSVKVSIDLSGVRKKLDANSLERGRYALANQAHADMDQFVPKSSGGGSLRTASNVTREGSVIYNMPYARKQFYAPGGWNYSTPGTGPRWDLKAKSLFLSDWIYAFTKGAGIN